MRFKAILVVIMLATTIKAYQLQANRLIGSEINKYIQKINSREIQKIYFNGNILTINQKDQIVEALAISKGKITAIGKNNDILKMRNKNTLIIDLKGKTMMPGFYDAHSHIVYHSLTQSLGFKLWSPPIGTVTSIKEIQEIVRQYIQKNNISTTTVIQGIGYNDLGLIQKRHPSRIDLDEISKDHMIILKHISGHMSAVNTKVIEIAGITNDTPDPDGGVIQRFQNGPYKGTPYGVFKQRAQSQYLDQFSKQLTVDDPESQKIVLKGVEDYIRAGITTAQDGFSSISTIKILQKIDDKLKIDIRSYMGMTDTFNTEYDQLSKISNKRFKIAGIKMITDGSIQGYTGYLKKPYYVQPLPNSQPQNYPCKEYMKVHHQRFKCNMKGTTNKNFTKLYSIKQSDNFRGFPTFPQQTLNNVFNQALKRNASVLVHSNGDAAIDMCISAVQQGRNIYPRATSKVVMIHAQTIGDSQLDKVKQLNISPSFFTGHTYYWGDDHRNQFLGPQRAIRISPAKTALSKNIVFSFHNDAPIVPINNGILMIIWSAVNRITYGGHVLGPNERISVVQALRGVTINSAMQNNQSHIKGSIEPGKLADLIILSHDPLTIDPLLIRNITVLETIKEGNSIYKNEIQQTKYFQWRL